MGDGMKVKTKIIAAEATEHAVSVFLENGLTITCGLNFETGRQALAKLLDNVGLLKLDNVAELVHREITVDVLDQG